MLWAGELTVQRYLETKQVTVILLVGWLSYADKKP